jgi:hypothetical protein
MHDKLAYPYCIENNKTFMLTNNRKSSFFDCHLWFLLTDYRLKKNIKDLFVGKVKMDVAPPLLLGEEL